MPSVLPWPQDIVISKAQLAKSDRFLRDGEEVMHLVGTKAKSDFGRQLGDWRIRPKLMHQTD